ncbi:MAG: RNA polymerase sigma factor [Vicinamibacterales bacterium]
MTAASVPAPVPSPPDVYADLVRDASSGDPAAMERLLTKVQEIAWRFSMSVCGRGADAEDAMQEALIKTYRYTSRIREPEAFRPWLHRTVKNACLMSRRRRVDQPKRLESIEAARADGGAAPIDPPDPGRNPEQITANSRLRGRLQEALRTLSPSLRAVVFLREMQGLSTREVAEAMGLSEANVKTRLSRARKALQAALEEAE